MIADVDNDIGPEYYEPDILRTSTKELAMRAFAFVVLTLAFPAAVTAQFDSGQISGFVRDAQQGALPGAAVTMTNERTGSAPPSRIRPGFTSYRTCRSAATRSPSSCRASRNSPNPASV